MYLKFAGASSSGSLPFYLRVSVQCLAGTLAQIRRVCVFANPRSRPAGLCKQLQGVDRRLLMEAHRPRDAAPGLGSQIYMNGTT